MVLYGGKATKRNIVFKNKTSINTSNVNNINTVPTSTPIVSNKRSRYVTQHNSDWRLKDIIPSFETPKAYADEVSTPVEPAPEITKEYDIWYNKRSANAVTADNTDTSNMSVFDENNPDHIKNSGTKGGILAGFLEWKDNVFTSYDDPSHPRYEEMNVDAVKQIEDNNNNNNDNNNNNNNNDNNDIDTFEPTPNIEKTDNFNEFVVPSSVGQFQDDPLLKEINASRDKNPDAFVGLGAWSKPQSTMSMSGGASGFDKALHGKVQTQLNKQDLNREMKDVNSIWRQDFVLTFGQEGAPTKAEARDWIDQQKQNISTRNNIGGYNYGGYQQMYMDDLEDRFTNLYSMGNKDNKNRTLTKAEELSNIQQERFLTDKEAKQLAILTGQKPNSKTKKAEVKKPTIENPFPEVGNNFGGYEQFL